MSKMKTKYVFNVKISDKTGYLSRLEVDVINTQVLSCSRIKDVRCNITCVFHVKYVMF